MLSSFNLSAYVIKPFTKDAYFDFKSFREDVMESVIFMNDLLDEGVPYLPLQEQKDSAIKYRQLGIGIMGMADMFIKMGIRYGSTESKNCIGGILKEMANASLQQSALLAKENGPYPAYDKEAILSSPYLNNVAYKYTMDLIKEHGLYNVELLSIAPTGSLSTLWGISGGAEPIFSLSHTRKSESLGENGEEVFYKVYAQIAREYLDLNPSAREEDLPDYFITAMELDYRERIELQGVLQIYVDSAISSTVNLPNSVTIEEIMDLYMYAWKQGLKGVTIYRSGCEREGILTAAPTPKKDIKDEDNPQECST